MENVIIKLAQRVKELWYSDYSVANQPKLPRISKTSEQREDNITRNKAVFSEIFGEEAPSWWGNFSVVKH